jgi:hypothetical protein
MTAKEKAEDLLYQMRYDHMSCTLTKKKAKTCARIAVDEIIYGYEFDSLDIEHKRIMDNINFWDEVKQEIERL